jgi:hypothetical protein
MSVAIALGVALLGTPVAAQNCGSPPSGYGPSWARAYAKWCRCMGGTPTPDAQGCRGVNGGGNRSDSSNGRSADNGMSPEAEAAAAAAEADRQREEADWEQQRDERRRQEEEERLRREAEQAKQRQEEFERNKQQVLRDLNGTALGLQGQGCSDSFGFNAPEKAGFTPKECKWGDQGSSSVDLRCLGLDPEKPITVDWHVVHGQTRVFPAQIDAATFQNANYNRGFEALMRTTFTVKDAQDAVALFKAAKLQRPNDALVRNALYLAEGILVARQNKDREQRAQAHQELYRGMAALMIGDVKTASGAIERAQKLDSDNSTIGAWSRLMIGLDANYSEGNRTACKFVGNALMFEAMGGTKSEIHTLEIANHMFPNDNYVKAMLWRAQHMKAENPDFSSVSPGATTRYAAGSKLKPDNPSGPGTASSPK